VSKLIVLEERHNQYGDNIPDRWIKYDNGYAVVKEVACLSSAELGLGICQCVNHPPIVTVFQSKSLADLKRWLREEYPPAEEFRLVKPLRLIIEEIG